MNPYEIIDKNPKLLSISLQEQINKVIQNLTHISLCYDDVEKQFFDMKFTSEMDKLIKIIYEEYAKGLINIYGCFINTNIKEHSLDNYTQNIILNQGLSDSDYYQGENTFDKIIKLMAYFDGREGNSNLLGYNLDSEEYPNFKVSKNIGEYFMVLGFTTVKYLNRGLEIVNNEELEDRSTGQALLIEALFTWIKIGNCLRIDINRAMNQFINK